MKKTVITLIAFASLAHAGIYDSTKAEIISGLNKLIVSEDLINCKSRSESMRFWTNDCNDYLTSVQDFMSETFYLVNAKYEETRSDCVLKNKCVENDKLLHLSAGIMGYEAEITLIRIGQDNDIQRKAKRTDVEIRELKSVLFKK